MHACSHAARTVHCYLRAAACDLMCARQVHACVCSYTLLNTCQARHGSPDSQTDGNISDTMSQTESEDENSQQSGGPSSTSSFAASPSSVISSSSSASATNTAVSSGSGVSQGMHCAVLWPACDAQPHLCLAGTPHHTARCTAQNQMRVACQTRTCTRCCPNSFGWCADTIHHRSLC